MLLSDFSLMVVESRGSDSRVHGRMSTEIDGDCASSGYILRIARCVGVVRRVPIVELRVRSIVDNRRRWMAVMANILLVLSARDDLMLLLVVMVRRLLLILVVMLAMLIVMLLLIASGRIM